MLEVSEKKRLACAPRPRKFQVVSGIPTPLPREGSSLTPRWKKIVTRLPTKFLGFPNIGLTESSGKWRPLPEGKELPGDRETTEGEKGVTRGGAVLTQQGEKERGWIGGIWNTSSHEFKG